MMLASRCAIAIAVALPLVAVAPLSADAASTGYWCGSPGAFGDCVDDPYVYTGGADDDHSYKHKPHKPPYKPPYKPPHKPPYKPPHKPDYPDKPDHHDHHHGPVDKWAPTYREYTMPSSIQHDAPAVHTAICEGDKDNRDSAVKVNGNSLPANDPGTVYEGGRAVGYSAADPFVLTCEDNHTAGHRFDL